MMRKYLNIDGPVFQLIDKIGQIIILSFLWIIGSVPIITLFTSNAALYYSVVKSIRYEQGNPVKEFWNFYLSHFLKGVCITLIFLFVVVLNGFLYFLLYSNDKPSAFCVLIGVILALIYVYLGPVLSRFSISCVKVIKLSFIIVVKNPGISALVLFLGFGLLVFQFAFFPMAGILLLPALSNYLFSYLLEKVLRVYMPEKNTDVNSWLYQS